MIHPPMAGVLYSGIYGKQPEEGALWLRIRGYWNVLDLPHSHPSPFGYGHTFPALSPVFFNVESSILNVKIELTFKILCYLQAL